MNDSISIEIALGYRAANLCVLPAIKAEKRPAGGSWKKWTKQLPTEYDVMAWFGNCPDGVCLVAGAVSGNLECLDFDNHGELFEAWKNRVEPELFKRLVVEKTPSGGFHVVYRCEAPIGGNAKLARGIRDENFLTLIETRGEGGLFLCAPTNGYELVQGDIAQVPTLTAKEREVLLSDARALDEARGVLSDSGQIADPGLDERFEIRPGDDFNGRGEIRSVLMAHGWTCLAQKQRDNELWRRPGKTEGGHSATFDGDVFYVFSSNAAPFEPGRGYCKFQVYAFLECGGDFTRAASELINKGYGLLKGIDPVDFSQLENPNGSASDSDEDDSPFVEELEEIYPKLRPVLIHGFLRLGETMNIIAPPKTGKSWLVTDLALSVATGTPWFGFPCEQGKVLIIDNELHPETSASRIPKVIEARGVPREKWEGQIRVNNQRGHIKSIEDFAGDIEKFKHYGIKLIIIDAFYRALPRGTDENDNAAMTHIYNLIDSYAAALNCAFILIHHTSKGNQSAKTVTDVGSGAGSQSRAADTHLILRHHKEKGAVVMESVVRSFPSVEPIGLRWNWPLWNRDDSLDTTQLDGMKEETEEGWSSTVDYTCIARQLGKLVKDPPCGKTSFTRIVSNAYGLKLKVAQLAVDEAIELGCIRYETLPDQSQNLRATKFILPPKDASNEL